MTWLDPEKKNAQLRARRRAGISCSECQMLKVRCEYTSLEEDCTRCRDKGSGCRYFESIAEERIIQLQEEDVRARADVSGDEGRSWTSRMSRQILATCTQHAALASARSDSDCDQVVDNLKQEWVYAWGWLMLLLTLDIALFTIGSPSLFTVDAFGQKVINASGVATIFGLLCDGWFYVRYHHLQTKAFLTRARDIYNGYAFFALSARLPSLGALLSLSALLMFVGRTAFKRAPVLVVVLIALFFVLLGLQFIVRGTEVVYCSVSGALSAVVGWAQRGREKIAALVENRNALQPPSLAETGRPEV